MSGNNAPPKSEPKALVSMICGILGLLCVLPVIGSLIAIITGHTSLSKINRSNGQLTGDGMALAGLITGYIGLFSALIAFLLAGMMLPVLSKAREKARRVNCAGNLKQIGLACLMYSGENSGFYPLTAPGNNFEPLNTEGVLNDGRVYGCPSASQLRSTARNSNYRYFGSGIKDDIIDVTTTVIACDEADNHDGKWINALFADGHVEGASGKSIEDLAKQRGWTVPGLVEGDPNKTSPRQFPPPY